MDPPWLLGWLLGRPWLLVSTLIAWFHMFSRLGEGVLPGMGLTPPSRLPSPPPLAPPPPRSTPRLAVWLGSLYAPIQFSIFCTLFSTWSKFLLNAPLSIRPTVFGERVRFYVFLQAHKSVVVLGKGGVTRIAGYAHKASQACWRELRVVAFSTPFFSPHHCTRLLAGSADACNHWYHY